MASLRPAGPYGRCYSSATRISIDKELPPRPLTKQPTLTDDVMDDTAQDRPESSRPATNNPTQPLATPDTSPTCPRPRYEHGTRSRYMKMLLALEDIPRRHNILSSMFNWILLVGLVILPGTFTSSSAGEGDTDAVPHQLVPLLVVAASAASTAVLGLLWLGLRWRHNYVWLLNRIYLSAALNAIAGCICTLTAVYAHQHGNWSVPARAAAVVEVILAVVCGGLFVFYKRFLLERIKNETGLDGGTAGAHAGRRQDHVAWLGGDTV